MTKRYSVSVSDELAQKIELHKNRLSLSKIFQDAMWSKVTKEEKFQQRLQEDQTVEQVIERLKQEKTRSEDDMFDTGRTDGQNFAKTAHYDELIYAISFDPFSENDEVNINVLETDDVLEDYFRDQLEKIREEHQLPVIDEDGDLTELAVAWLKGWIQGVQDFWDNIKDKL